MCDISKCSDFQYIQCICQNETTLQYNFQTTYDKVVCNNINYKHVIAAFLSLIFCIRYCIYLTISIALSTRTTKVARIYANLILFAIWLINFIRCTSPKYILIFIGNSQIETHTRYEEITHELFIYPVIWLCIVILNYGYGWHKKYVKHNLSNLQTSNLQTSNLQTSNLQTSNLQTRNLQTRNLQTSNSAFDVVIHQSSEKVIV